MTNMNSAWFGWLAHMLVASTLIAVIPFEALAASIKLNGALVIGGNVQHFEISPDGSRVVYQANQDLDGVLELFSVPSPVALPRSSTPHSPAGVMSSIS